jgi:hypothetical protein
MVATSNAGTRRRRFWLNKVAIAMAVLTAVALGVLPGSFVGCVEDVDICGNSAGPPDLCGCGSGPGKACMQFTDCCSRSCVDGVCACSPKGGYCMTFADCCSHSCTAGICDDEASDASAEGPEASADGPIDSCDGTCLKSRPGGWDLPTLVWIGLESNAPPCPDAASIVSYEGRLGPSAHIKCEPCQCGSPTGSCGLPATLTVSSTPCPGTGVGAAHLPFDPPSGWDGGCTANEAIDGGQLCDGGPCVRSLAVGAPTLVETGCAVMEHPIEQGSVSWAAFARSCVPGVEQACEDNHGLCLPTAPGFKACVFQPGELNCPTDIVNPYTERHVFFEGLMDTRGCTACACDPPAGGVCSAEVFLYGDSACATVPSYAETVLSTGAECLDLAPGAALGSKSASPPTYTPGACQPSGGEPTGGVTALMPSTFCCIP